MLDLLWNTEVADHNKGYTKTAAPLIVKDMVVTGIAGGEFGIRGFIDAYDAQTGHNDDFEGLHIIAQEVLPEFTKS